MKQLLTIGLIGLLLLTLAACGKPDQGPEDSGNTTNTTDNINDTDDDATGTTTSHGLPNNSVDDEDIITIGEIVAFEDGQIHIISGDLVQVFDYDDSNADAFYVGQTVQLIQGETGNILENYLIEDFSIKHTNMGDLLTEVKGTISKMTDNEISIETEEGLETIKIHRPLSVVEGTEVNAVCGDFGKVCHSYIYLMKTPNYY
jgi:predicted small lipoprotein YifL